MVRKILMLVPAAFVLIGARDPGSGEGGSTSIVSLEAISVPIVDGGRINGALQVRLAFRPRDGDADAVLADVPQLRSGAVETVGEHARLHASPWQAVDAARLAAALSERTRRTSPHVQEVLLIELRARRL